MKRNLVLGIISLILLVFLVVPQIPAFSTGTCTGSLVCTLQDAFHFSDYLANVVFTPVLTLTDSFHFSDVPPTVFLSSVSGYPCSNPFVTNCQATTSGQPNPYQYLDTSSGVGIAVTQIGIPVALLLACMIIPMKWGMKSFYVIFPVVNFVLLALAWIKVLPSWLIPVDIVIVAAGVAFMVIQLFSGGQAQAAEE